MCGRTGLAEMSDDKSSNIGDYHTRLEAVPEGFEIKGNDVICSACQVSALPFKPPRSELNATDPRPQSDAILSGAAFVRLRAARREST